MGFLEALVDMGKVVGVSGKGIFKYASPLGKPSDFVLLRVHLSVEDKDGMPLQVVDVTDVDVKEIDDWSEQDFVAKLPFVKTNANASYQMMPFLNISKLKNKVVEQIPEIPFEKVVVDGKVADTIDGKKTKNFMLPNLVKRMLWALEEEGGLSSGSTKKIYEALRAKGYEVMKDILADKNLKKKKVVVVLGVSDNGTFLYPSEVKAFVAFFEGKMEEKLARERQKMEGKKTGGGLSSEHICPICGNPATKKLSEVIKFATLDKPGFIHMMRDQTYANFYICDECYQHMLKAVSYIERQLTVKKYLPGLEMWIVPEVFTDSENVRKAVIEKVADIVAENDKILNIRKGTETSIWKALAGLGGSVVLHILFVRRQNQKVEVRLMLEDVPPSRLEHIASVYAETLKKKGVDYLPTLDNLMMRIRQFFVKYLTLPGSKDKSFALDKVLATYAALLMNERLNISMVKEYALKSVVNLSGQEHPESRLKELMDISTELVDVGLKLEEVRHV